MFYLSESVELALVACSKQCYLNQHGLFNWMIVLLLQMCSGKFYISSALRELYSFASKYSNEVSARRHGRFNHCCIVHDTWETYSNV